MPPNCTNQLLDLAPLVYPPSKRPQNRRGVASFCDNQVSLSKTPVSFNKLQKARGSVSRKVHVKVICYMSAFWQAKLKYSRRKWALGITKSAWFNCISCAKTRNSSGHIKMLHTETNDAKPTPSRVLADNYKCFWRKLTPCTLGSIKHFTVIF